MNKEWEVLDEAGEVMPKAAHGKKASKHGQSASADIEAEYEFV